MSVAGAKLNSNVLREVIHPLTGQAHDYDPVLSVVGDASLSVYSAKQHGGDAILIGFTTYKGTVTAASGWDGPAERKRVRPALAESYETLFHESIGSNFLLTIRTNDAGAKAIRQPRLERAIGVIYLPQTERQSHYFDARLAEQFDAVIHFDETQALEPLERHALWETGEPPETFPTGM